MSIIEFNIHVDNPGQQLALYDRIQVWRSATENGTYADITADSPTAAFLDGSIAGPWNLNGKAMTVTLNGAVPVTINFSGVDPLPLITVLAQINAVIPGFASEVPNNTGKVRVTSPIVGTQSSILLSGNACAVFGIATTKTNGLGARPLLVEVTEDYDFRDYDGDSTFWYKTRFYSSITGRVSSYSTPAQYGVGSALTGSLVVTGKVALSDASGKPVVGRRIIFVPVSPQIVADGSGNNYGVLPSVERIEITTDANGRASVTLVKGQRLKVFLEGTTFQREFIVPTTDFDILTVASTQPDPLNIVTTPPFPIRVSN